MTGAVDGGRGGGEAERAAGADVGVVGSAGRLRQERVECGYYGAVAAGERGV